MIKEHFRFSAVKYIFFGLFLAFISVNVSPQVSAAPTTPGMQSAYNNWSVRRLPESGHMLLSTGYNDSNGTGNHTPGIKFLVYKEAGTAQLSVDVDTSANCSDFPNDPQHKWIYQVDNDNTNFQSSTLAGSFPLDCNNISDGIRLTLYDSQFAPSVRYGDDYEVALVELELEENSGNKPEKTVSVIVKSHSGSKLSYYGDRSEYGGNDFPRLNSAPSITLDGNNSTISIDFAPPCNFGTHNVNIYWRDADSGQAPNDNDAVTYRISEVNGKGEIQKGDAGDGSKGEKRTFEAREKYKYRLTFYHVKAEPFNNTIKIWYPFDQAAFYQSCDEPFSNGWAISWNSYLRRDDGDTDQISYGDEFYTPDYITAPEPGRTYQFINDARNVGDRNITNQVWYCPDIAPNVAPGNCWNSANNLYDRDWDITNNTQQINFYQDGNLVAGDSKVYGTDEKDLLVDGPWVWGAPYTVSKADGGTSRCMTASVSPSYGNGTSGSFKFNDAAGFYNASGAYDAIGDAGRTRSWDIGGTATAQRLCVYVPHYYSMTSVMTTHPVTMTQQGDGVTVRGEVTNPLTDTSGRHHTNSHDTLAKGIVEFQVPAGVPEPVVDAEASNPLAPCAWVSSKVTGSSACDDTKGRQTTPVLAGEGPMVLSYTRPPLDTISLSVGTKLCYAIYVQHPKHVNSADAANINGPYSYTSIDCTVVVKSPKVQFENGDLTVGRHWIDGQTHSNLTACEDMVGTASITASGAPDVVRDDTTGTFVPKERYGSWVEYGAFARGAISGMGTGSRPFGLGADTVDGAKRLMFSNTVTGGFDYGVTCLNNPFETIRTDDPTKITNLASLPAIPAKPSVFDGDGNLRINELAELYDNSYDKTGYVSKGKDIKVTPRPKDAYSVRVKLKAAGQSGNEVPNGPLSPPKVRVSVGNDSGVYEDKEIVVNSAYPDEADYEAIFNLGDAGYKGPQDVSGSNPTIDIDFVNNNHNDAWDTDSSKMTDRNLYLGDITVEWLKNGAVIDSSGPHAPASLAKDGHDYYTGNAGAPCPTQTANGSGLFPILSSTGDNGYQLGYCHGVHLYQTDLGFNPEPAPPSLLSEDYPNFGGDGTRNGRDIVLYAQRDDPSKDCSDPANDGSGNLFIDQDIVYKRSGYSKLTELPRLVFVADCDITIANDVSNIYASLIAGDAVKTCSTKAKTVSDCEKNLRIVGAVSANRLLLWRTYGADLTSAGAAQTPAESFSMSPSQMITGYTRGNDTPKPKTAHQKDLPPRY